MKLRHLLASLFACLAFISCDKDQQDQISINKEEGHDSVLPMPDSLTAHPLGDSFTMSYTSQYKWKVPDTPVWITVKPKNGGPGTTKIEITIDPFLLTDETDSKTTNTDSEGTNKDKSREQVIYFNNDGGKPDMLSVTQYKPVLEVSIDKPENNDYKHINNDTTSDDVIFEWKKSSDEGGAGFNVKSNINWTIDIDNKDNDNKQNPDYKLCQIEYVNGKPESSIIDFSNMNVYGAVGENEDPLTFKLSANNPNLSKGERHLSNVTITPVKYDNEGKVIKLDDSVLKALQSTIQVSQEHLIFYLDGDVDSEVKESIRSYVLKSPFSELGNNYLESINQEKDIDNAYGKQEFSIIYEKDKVNFSDWEKSDDNCIIIPIDSTDGYLNKDNEFIEGGTSDPNARICRKMKMSLVMPSPSATLLTDTSKTKLYSLSLPLIEKDGTEIAEIKLDYSQNNYELSLKYNTKKIFKNSGGESDTLHVIVNTIGPWHLKTSNKESWLKIPDQGFGQGRKEVPVFAAEKNLEFEDKSATLTLCAYFGESDSEELVHESESKLKQAKFQFNAGSFNNNEGSKEITINRLDTSEYKIPLESYGRWKLTSDQDWISAKASNGSQTYSLDENKEIKGEAGEWEIVVRANRPNPEDEARTVKLTICSVEDGHDTIDAAKKDFSVTQKKYVFDLSKNNATPEAYKASPEVFDVNCGAPWKITSKPKWVIIEANKNWPSDKCPAIVTSDGLMEGNGLYDAKGITLKFHNNNGEDYDNDGSPDYDWNSPREGEIIVESYKDCFELPSDSDEKGVVDKKTYKITQEAFVFKIYDKDGNEVVSTTDYSPFTALDRNDENLCVTNEFSIDCTKEAGWSITEIDDEGKTVDYNWFECRTEGYSGKRDVSFTLQPNGDVKSTRTARIKVSSEIVDKSVILTIPQAAYQFDSNKVDWAEKEDDWFCELEPESKRFYLKCLGPWKIDNAPDGWTVTPNEGEGSDEPVEVEVKPSSNYGTKALSGSFEVVSQIDNHTHKKEISYVQRNFVWSNDNWPEKLELGVLQESTKQLSFTCSDKWSASIDDGQDKSKDEFKVKFEENGELKSTVSGDGGRTNTEIITIKVPKNYTTSERNVKVQVSTGTDQQGNKRCMSLPITQDAYVFNVKDSEGSSVTDDNNTKSVSASDTTLTFTVECTGGFNAVPMDTTSFLKQDKIQKEGNTVTVTVPLNASLESREAELIIRSKDVDKNDALQQVIKIKQAGYKFVVKDSEGSFVTDDNNTKSVSASETTLTFTVECSGSWTVSLDADAQKFVKVNGSTSVTGKGTKIVTVTVASNKKASETAEATVKRSGTITVSTTNGSIKTETIIIIQAGDK